MLLELLPPLAELADRSADCSRLLIAFCSLAAAACSPRDLITACLEVLSNLVETSRCALSNASSQQCATTSTDTQSPEEHSKHWRNTLGPLCAAAGLSVQSWARRAAVCMQPAAHAPRASREAQSAQGSQCCGVLLGCRRTRRGMCVPVVCLVWLGEGGAGEVPVTGPGGVVDAHVLRCRSDTLQAG